MKKRRRYEKPTPMVVERPKKKNKISKKKRAKKRDVFAQKLTEKYDGSAPVEVDLADDSDDGVPQGSQDPVSATVPMLNTRKTMRPISSVELQDEFAQYGYANKPVPEMPRKVGKQRVEEVELSEEEPEMEADMDGLQDDEQEGDDAEDVQELNQDDAEEDDQDILTDISFSEPDEEEVVTRDLRQDMSNLPLGKLLELKNKIGIKLFNKTFYGKDNEAATPVEPTEEKAKKFRRDNPKRPREITSKRPVSRFRDIYANESKGRQPGFDPRFDERCGEYNEKFFERSYGHIETIRAKELLDMKGELVKAKANGDARRIAEIKETIKRAADRARTKKDRALKRDVVVNLKEENIQRLKEGLKPVFKTKGEVRRLQKERQQEMLKKEGRLDKNMERREKKQKRKERVLRQKLEDHAPVRR
ncbi:unnamed protein product, partial [Mesorhabditis spiculigera]